MNVPHSFIMEQKSYQISANTRSDPGRGKCTRECLGRNFFTFRKRGSLARGSAKDIYVVLRPHFPRKEKLDPLFRFSSSHSPSRCNISRLRSFGGSAVRCNEKTPSCPIKLTLIRDANKKQQRSVLRINGLLILNFIIYHRRRVFYLLICALKNLGFDT